MLILLQDITVNQKLDQVKFFNSFLKLFLEESLCVGVESP